MPAHGASWFGTALSFVGMWVSMMVPMMLPAVIPSLVRYRRAIGTIGGRGPGPLTALAGAGYFLVWAVVGVLLYPLAAALAALEAREPALAGVAPIAAGAVVLIAGLLQVTAWKARGIACCRGTPQSGTISVGAGAAWRHGVQLGLDCVRCCGNLMAALLALGMMDLRWMVAVGAAITVERVAPPGAPLARAIGMAVIAWGVVLIARASGLS